MLGWDQAIARGMFLCQNWHILEAIFYKLWHVLTILAKLAETDSYWVTDADIAKEVDMEKREQDIAKLGYVNEI